MTSKSDGAIDSVCLILLGLLSFVAASSTILVVVQKVKAAQAKEDDSTHFRSFDWDLFRAKIILNLRTRF